MTDTDKLQKIITFMEGEMVGVLSTVSPKTLQPQSALVGITETEDGSVIFGTNVKTRKYENLQHNARVSLVVGTDYARKITVQYEGTARELDGEQQDTCRELHVKKHPGSAKFLQSPHERIFLITPTWIRYTDYSGPPVEFEIINS